MRMTWHSGFNASIARAKSTEAGTLLIPWWARRSKPPDELGHAYEVIQNWRSAHAWPLNAFQMSLRTRTKQVEPKPIVAQRLKRFSSVMNKLAREPNMKLSQMQDLGGCRTIVSSVKKVDQLVDLYLGKHKLLFKSERTLKRYDYIRHPKDDGYRGVHLVGRYYSRSDRYRMWNGQRVEVQIRSSLQHAFATAVETVTTFTRTPLKFGSGPTDWRRFFALMGSALAHREGTTMVDGTPSNVSELIAELRDVTEELRVIERLRVWAHALKSLPRRNIKTFNWLLLVLDLDANTIRVVGFRDRQKAAAEVASLEQQQGKNVDAVLVWVRSARQLRAAYPNYYADTGSFISALELAIGSVS